MCMGTADRKGLLGHSTDTMSRHYVQQAEMERRRVVLNAIAGNLLLNDEPENEKVMRKALAR